MTSTIREPHYIQPQQWREAIDMARETCARAFRDGRSPTDVLRAHGLAPAERAGWGLVVGIIAELHCALAGCRHVGASAAA